MSEEKFAFQAEVSKLLDIVAHSLYSHKEIFLRELISNASDACDRLRYEALTRPELAGGDNDFKISLEIDKKAKTLTVADNGIGMTHDELTENLGTIARSGTQSFVEQLTDGGENGGDMALIGQFGVGFYSAFMVAKKVEVISRKAGEESAWKWTSDGKGEFTLAEGARDAQGTSVKLFLEKKEGEFLEAMRVRTIVKTYSDHIGVPIQLKDDGTDETLNEGSALWARPAKDITSEQYKEFYHHVGQMFDEPWKILHNRVEGILAYTNLLFIPSSPPFDLYDPDRKPRVKLYVKRVFITDDCEALMPSYLRFLRGIVDSEDLSLNISREMLQENPKLAKIRSGLVKRVLNELKKTASKKADEYAKFWDNFGAVLKEGLYEDFENRDRILPLCRFRSLAGDDAISLETYVENMKEGQDDIFYITGEDIELLRKSPQLEGFKARGVDVLLMTDPIDDFWIGALGTFQDKPFKSITRGGADLDKIALSDEAKEKEAGDDAQETPGIDQLVAALKMALDTSVKDVWVSARLTDSAVCLVADEGDMDIRLERILRQSRRMGEAGETPRILEINPKHGLIRRLAARVEDTGAAGADAISASALLLLDQARILEGEQVADPIAFAERLSEVMEKGLA
ncbi:MAG: molecular chaperone HtpG [Rhodospirillales bacterium]|nr:molecular chaperone HtpG [Rhodospirillales bacterium]